MGITASEAGVSVAAGVAVGSSVGISDGVGVAAFCGGFLAVGFGSGVLEAAGGAHALALIGVTDGLGRSMAAQ